MITLYQKGEPYYILGDNGLETHFRAHPVLFSDMFPLFSGLKFDWDEQTVERNGKVYYFDTEMSFGNLPTPNEWMSVAGNVVKYEYYSASTIFDPKNPSGNSENVHYIKYLTKDVVKYLIEIEYDVKNNPTVRRSLPVETATAGDIGGVDDDEFIDSGDRLPLDRLNIIPFMRGGKDYVNGGYVLESNKDYIFVSQTSRKKPIYSDGILLDNSVSKLLVKFDVDASTAIEYIELTLLDSKGNVLEVGDYDFKEIYHNHGDGIVFKHQSEDDNYLLVTVSTYKELSTLTSDQLTQKALGISITSYGYFNLTIVNSVNPFTEPIRIPEGDTILADYLPENTDPNFAGYVDSEGNSVIVDVPVYLSRDLSITATYN